MHGLMWEPFANRFLCISVLKVASGPWVKLASCKSALTPPQPPAVYFTDRSKAVVPVLVLLFGALWFILRGDLLYVLPCAGLFSPFSIAITSLREERANLSAFCMFDRFVHIWICRFPLPLDVWEGLRFVIVALPRLFSYPFFSMNWLENELTSYLITQITPSRKHTYIILTPLNPTLI